MYEVIRDEVRLVKGDSFIAQVEIYQDGEPYTPAPGDTIRFAMKKRYSDAVCVILKTIPNDTLLLRLEPEDTKDLAVMTYVYDIEITLENGFVDTFIRGEFKLLNEVI